MSVTLTGLFRISKTRFCWKELSLKKLLFFNLCPASRGPSIFLDKLGRLKKRCVTRQNRNNTRALNKSSFKTQKPSLEFRETSIFYIRHSKGFWETIYFSRNITRTTRIYRESTEQLHLRVKVLSEKRPNEMFLSVSLENYLSIFVPSLSFELSTLNCLYFVKVCMCIACDCVN